MAGQMNSLRWSFETDVPSSLHTLIEEISKKHNMVITSCTRRQVIVEFRRLGFCIWKRFAKRPCDARNLYQPKVSSIPSPAQHLLKGH